RVTDLEDAPPMAFRRCGDTFYLVATAAGPIGTDRVSVQVEVGRGARAVVRTVGATIAYAGVDARLDVAAVVEEEASLHWLPDPLVVTGPCSLTTHSTVTMAGSARVVWVEELVLGRHTEEPGRLHHCFRADVDGRPLLRHDLSLGPGADGWDGPAVLGGNRAVGFRLAAGADLPAVDTTLGDGWATLDLSGPGRLTVAAATDLRQSRARLGPDPRGL